MAKAYTKKLGGCVFFCCGERPFSLSMGLHLALSAGCIVGTPDMNHASFHLHLTLLLLDEFECDYKGLSAPRRSSESFEKYCEEEGVVGEEDCVLQLVQCSALTLYFWNRSLETPQRPCQPKPCRANSSVI